MSKTKPRQVAASVVHDLYTYSLSLLFAAGIVIIVFVAIRGNIKEIEIWGSIGLLVSLITLWLVRQLTDSYLKAFIGILGILIMDIFNPFNWF